MPMMSPPASPQPKRARTGAVPPSRAPPLQCRTPAGRYKHVQCVVPAAGEQEDSLLVRFTDDTQLLDSDGAPLAVPKKQLVFFAQEQPPDARAQVGALAGAPRFFNRQQECFDHADQHGHKFFGAFQILRKKWVWRACKCQPRLVTCAQCQVRVEDVSASAGEFYEEAVYQYFSMPTVAAFLQFYDSVPQANRFFFEILREGRLLRPYLDVDNLVVGVHEPCNDALNKILGLLRRFYHAVFARELLPAQIRVTTGGRAKPDGFKNSWHVGLDTGYGFPSAPKGGHGDMKLFMFAFIEALREAHPELRDAEVSVPHGNLPVDHRVYTANRTMRMPLSCKVGDTVWLKCIPGPGECDGSLVIESYLLQTDQPLEQYVFSAETRTELEAGAKLRAPPSASQAPAASSATRERCDLSDLPEDVQDALTRHANELAPNCTMRSVEKIFDDVISVYCATRGWYCPLHKRTHDSNNFCLWYVPSERAIKLKCMSSGVAPLLLETLSRDEETASLTDSTTTDESPGVPTDILEKIHSLSQQHYPGCSLGEQFIVNEGIEDQQVFCVALTGIECMCQVHSRPCDLEIRYYERARNFRLLCRDYSGEGTVIGEMRAEVRTLYDILGVSSDASLTDLRRAYHEKARQCHPDKGGSDEAFQEIENAYDTLKDPTKRKEYDSRDDDGDDTTPYGDGTPGFRRAPLTLRDLYVMNCMFYDYLIGEYSQYLSGNGDFDTVVAKGSVVTKKKGGARSVAMIDLPGTMGRCKCPFRHKVDKQCGLTLQYCYSENELKMHCNRRLELQRRLRSMTLGALLERCVDEGYPINADKDFARLRREDDVDEKTLKTYVIDKIIYQIALYDPCIEAADNDLTEKMFQRFISVQFQDIVFLREKGPKYAVPTAAGSYDLYAGQHKVDLLSANASTELDGCELNFRPFMANKLIMRNLPFKWCFDLLERSPWRIQKNKVVFFPALPPYDNVDAQIKKDKSEALCLDNLNLFTKLRITESEARKYCLENGILADEDFDADGSLTDDGMETIITANACILKHLEHIVCRDVEADYEYLLSYMAHTVQFPWRKPKVAIVMRSDGKGAGKGVIVFIMHKIIGDGGASNHAISISDSNALLGQFNGVRSGKLMIVLDESYWAGSKRDKGKLRNLVTEDTHDIRLMQTNPYTEDSYIRIWFLSNDIHLVPFDEGERRFKCFNLLNEYAGIENERTKAYFKPLWAHPPEVFAMFLYHHDIRGWSPREFDIGVAGQEQMMATLRGVQLWWKSRLGDGVVAVEKQDRYADSQHNAKVPHRRSWPFGGLPVPKTVIYADYHRFCKGNRVAGTAEIDSTAFKQLYQLVPKLESKTFSARDNYAQQDAQRPQCLLFPTLRECRDAWRQKYGDVDTDGWDDDVDDDKVTYSGGGRYEEPSWMAI